MPACLLWHPTGPVHGSWLCEFVAGVVMDAVVVAVLEVVVARVRVLLVVVVVVVVLLLLLLDVVVVPAAVVALRVERVASHELQRIAQVW